MDDKLFSELRALAERAHKFSMAERPGSASDESAGARPVPAPAVFREMSCETSIDVQKLHRTFSL
jgi:hypothetical protein